MTASAKCSCFLGGDPSSNSRKKAALGHEAQVGQVVDLLAHIAAASFGPPGHADQLHPVDVPHVLRLGAVNSEVLRLHH